MLTNTKEHHNIENENIMPFKRVTSVSNTSCCPAWMSTERSKWWSICNNPQAPYTCLKLLSCFELKSTSSDIGSLWPFKRRNLVLFLLRMSEYLYGFCCHTLSWCWDFTVSYLWGRVGGETVRSPSTNCGWSWFWEFGGYGKLIGFPITVVKKNN